MDKEAEKNTNLLPDAELVNQQDRGIEKSDYLVLMGLVVLSMIINIVWLIFYPSNWWNKVYVDDGSQVGVRKADVVVSWALPFLDLILLVMLFRCYTLSPPYKKVLRK